jgi:hypothetical protein
LPAATAPPAAAATAAGAGESPYSSAAEALDIAEHLSGTKMDLAMFRDAQPISRYSSSSSSNPGRQLLVVVDQLDNFRRGPMREQCAREAASDWRPYKLFNLTNDITDNPRYSDLLQGGDVVAVISEATANLNKIRAEAPVQQPATAAATTAAAAAPAASAPPPATKPAATAAASTPAASATAAPAGAVSLVQSTTASQQQG